MKTKQVKVTTTPRFEDVEIEEYLEPITAHVVVGLNIFKDLLAGLSDVFGGKSQMYQKTLASINEEVIEEMRKKAYSIGANCVLGLSINNDEIAAQGKSMMMVTAIGTAARAAFSQKEIAFSEDRKIESVSDEEFKYYKQKKKYLADSEANELFIDDQLWEFVKSNKVHELASWLINKTLHIIDSYQGTMSEFANKHSKYLIEYLSVIDQDIVKDCLYRKLKEASSESYKKIVREKICEMHLTDFERVIDLLQTPDFATQKSALKLLEEDKASYTKSDLPYIDRIIALISEVFKEKRGSVITKKTLLSKEKEVWLCECQKENDMNKAYCENCGKDIYGFYEEDITSQEIVKKLSVELEMLKTIFS